eukprot:408715_1
MIESKPSTSDIFYNPSSAIAITWGQFFVGVALYVLSYYLIDDAFGIWNVDMVTSSNIAKFIIGLLLLPSGLILWQSSIFKLSSHIGYHWIGNIVFLFIFVIVLFTIGAVYFVKWGILDWLQWDQTFSSEALVKLMQGVFLVLTMWLTGITVFHVLLRAILMRNLYTTEAQINDSINSHKDHMGSNAEQQPLIGATEMTNASGMGTTQSVNNNGMGIDYNRHNYQLDSADKQFEATSNKFFEYASVFLFFFVYIPIFLWINCLNVSDWHRMYPSMIITKLASTTALIDSWNIYFQFTCAAYDIVGNYEQQTCYARLYYDLLYWYLFIFWIAMFCYITNKIPTIRIFLRKRVYLGINCYYIHLISVTIGEIIFWILWIIMMALIGNYFVKIHLYDEAEKTTIEIWA